MTEENKIQLRERYRDYRRLMEVRAEQSDDGDMIVRGTPIIFDKEYKLFEFNGTEIYEIIKKSAFDKTEMADVPLKYNHGDSKGTPARTTAKGKQGKLTLTMLEDRMDMEANLLPTSGGKDLFLEIQSGTVSQMSWAFTENAKKSKIIEDKENKKITFIVNEVMRIFDVSAVDFGANPATSIYARRREDLDLRVATLDERKRAADKLKLKLKLQNIK